MSSPDTITLETHHYSDREPWACLDRRRESDFDLHWEDRSQKENACDCPKGISSPCASSTETTPVAASPTAGQGNPSVSARVAGATSIPDVEVFRTLSTSHSDTLAASQISGRGAEDSGVLSIMEIGGTSSPRESDAIAISDNPHAISSVSDATLHGDTNTTEPIEKTRGNDRSTAIVE